MVRSRRSFVALVLFTVIALFAGLLGSLPSAPSPATAATDQQQVDKSGWPAWEQSLPIDAAQEAHLDRSADRVSWLNADGSRTMRTYTAPVNFTDAQGNWKASDTRLIDDGHGGSTAAATPVGVTFAGSTAGNFATLSKSGASVSFGFDGIGTTTTSTIDATSAAALVSSSPAHDSLSYTGVVPNGDLRFQVTTAGVKEWLVLNAPPTAKASATTLRFPLALHGLSAKQLQDGSIAFTDTSGATVVTIPPPRLSRSLCVDGLIVSWGVVLGTRWRTR